MDVDNAFARFLVDEGRHLSQLIGGWRCEIQNGNVAIAERAERLRLGKFGGEIEHRSHAQTRGCGRFALAERSANPDFRSYLVPWLALTLIVAQRESLA